MKNRTKTSLVFSSPKLPYSNYILLNKTIYCTTYRTTQEVELMLNNIYQDYIKKLYEYNK